MERVLLGSSGPTVELLQSILKRQKFYTGAITGDFDENTNRSVRQFQSAYGLIADGIAGRGTWRALYPFFNGYDSYTIKDGDTLYQIAAKYGITLNSILTANPGIDTQNLRIGQKIVVPFGQIITTDVSYTYELMEMNLRALQIVYPFLEMGFIGNSVLAREIPYVKVGSGQIQLCYCASFHANEWITTPVLMKFIEQFSNAYVNNVEIYGYDADALFNKVSLYVIPMVNPDGVDLVTGAISQRNPAYDYAKHIAEQYPLIPFPDGWKANIEGIDLNLQYPAGWEKARENKYRLGFIGPAPRDYVGAAPLTANEAKAVYDFTLEHDFRLMLTYHTQGEVIYWKYLDYLPPRSLEIGRAFASASGYELEETPYASSFAGYKDWFIQQYNRPGYTIEAGIGVNPLPISQFSSIYDKNIGILVLGMGLI